MTSIVVIKVGAEWCAPCRKLESNFKLIKDSFDTITFETLDITDVDPKDMERMNSWGVTQVPSVVVKINDVVKGFIQTSDHEKVMSFIELFV